MRKRRTIHASAKQARIVAMSADVTITAAEGEAKGPATFDVLAYNGGALEVSAFDHPVVVDLAGLQPRKTMVANLDHKDSQRVGNVTGFNNDGKQLRVNGIASAATAFRDEVIASAKDGFTWQASIEATAPSAHTDFLKAGKTATVNGQQVTGPAYIVRKSTLKGFAFVSHGADDSTAVSIAAAAASSKENDMDPKFVAWLEAQGLEPETIEADEKLCKTLEAAWKKEAPPSKKEVKGLKARLAAERAERSRVSQIEELAVLASDDESDERIQELAAEAIESGATVEAFELDLYRIRAGANLARFTPNSNGKKPITGKVLEAALCMAGRLPEEKLVKSTSNRDGYDEATLEAADREFAGGISLYEALWVCAQANGYRGRRPLQITPEIQNYAFGLSGGREVRASGFSTVAIPNVLSNVANKFLRQGWNAVDLTPLNISAIRGVRDFKTITTVSLTGDLTYAKVGAGGEITHGTLGEETYTNKADTYARMLAITRTDLINDDLGALTAVPMKLGRGAALKLNDIFWTEFLNNSTFFHSDYSNVNTGVADMTIGGLTATEVIFMNQTDPNSNPLGIMPAILLVPTALKAAALTLMSSEKLIDGTATGVQGDTNIFRGRFRVESSPYMANSSYTGYSAAAWYMLANPAELPVIEIVALNGRVEPVVETADAAFNVLGIQMRGYSDIGVNLQEKKGGVRADGGSS